MQLSYFYKYIKCTNFNCDVCEDFLDLHTMRFCEVRNHTLSGKIICCWVLISNSICVHKYVLAYVCEYVCWYVSHREVLFVFGYVILIPQIKLCGVCVVLWWTVMF